ncbi:MAG: hypothetical protein L6W00_23445 [Lentisphaeria bacterium]|nr:MAG: hypothetical protein L6W00_23445 [Lentisphaeria bacterium]
MELSREAGKVPDPQLADALHFLEYHQSEPFHVKALAAELHVTPDFLNRLFLKELGIPRNTTSSNSGCCWLPHFWLPPH